MAFELESALYQWREGEERLRGAPPLEQFDLERAAAAVGDELRRRLGSSFTVIELAVLYTRGTEWAEALAARNRAGTDTSAVVDAAFGRYAGEAKDFAGGRLRRGED
ncbi:MAG: hypothetical protein AABM29_11545 [Actinomycetota bacterium]|nr:hypothetical protein [Thermoleophilaceae bacterium]